MAMVICLDSAFQHGDPVPITLGSDCIYQQQRAEPCYRQQDRRNHGAANHPQSGYFVELEFIYRNIECKSYLSGFSAATRSFHRE